VKGNLANVNWRKIAITLIDPALSATSKSAEPTRRKKLRRMWHPLYGRCKKQQVLRFAQDDKTNYFRF
jgi:hypothetical protein